MAKWYNNQMRKVIFACIVLVVIFGLFIYTKYNSKEGITRPVSLSGVSSSREEKQVGKEEYVFIPYWTLDSDISSSPTPNLIYFGIEANASGINHDETGYKKIDEFVVNSGNKTTYLTIRMLNSDANLKILKDKTLQDKIINESILIAKENGFSGIVLDFEIKGLPFESFVKSITDLNKAFYEKVHADNLMYATLLYGDAFYRVRPFDAENIAKYSDRLFIMAYDFSKANGNPGPNFPFDEKEFGYSFKTMIEDYLQVVPKEKLTIFFGMFGYDWKIDEEKRGKEAASSKTTLQLERFMTGCVSGNTCTTTSSEGSGTSITYSDDIDSHVIWFEDYSSVERKIQYLNSKGIYSVGYWAYGYY